MPYDGQVLIPTLIGSLLSCIATTCVLVAYVKYADQQRSFRHALVLNLALAEFINTLNNSISGFYVLKNRDVLTPGPACVANGWIGQWSVQAADFCILAIAVVTLLTVTCKTYMPDVSLTKKVLICASVWIIPTITASTAAGMGEITPVSGNWCWISSERTDLRYALGHGWRFAIIFTTLGLYAYIWVHVRRHFKHLRIIAVGQSESTHKGSTLGRQTRPRSESQTELNEITVDIQFEMKQSKEESLNGSLNNVTGRQPGTVRFETSKSEPGTSSPKDSVCDVPYTYGHAATIESAAAKPLSATRQRKNVEREIKKTLLLNAYPLLYILLWAPGLINRLVEASGHKSRVLTIMQCSTQFVGLANAITYGLNEHLKRSVKRDLANLFGNAKN